MTFSAVPYALQNGSHSADLFRQAASSLVPPGGGIVTTGDLNVTQTGTPSMNVLIGVGRAWIPGTNVGNVTGGNFSNQAMYYGQNDAAYTTSVATSDPINPRIDVVYAAVQDSQYSGTSNAGVLAVATGVPTAGATYPANAPTLPANAIALAWINVAASASSILNSNITKLAVGSVTRSITSTTAVTDGFWTITGNMIKTIVDGQTQVTAALQLVRSGANITVTTAGNALIVGMIPSGFRPPGNFSLISSVIDGSDARYAEIELIVNNGGSVVGRSTSGGSITISTGYKLYITGTWFL